MIVQWLSQLNGAIRENAALIDALMASRNLAPSHPFDEGLSTWQPSSTTKVLTAKGVKHERKHALFWIDIVDEARRGRMHNVAEILPKILPYRFVPEAEDTRILSVARATQRGYWACGDTTALVLALAASCQTTPPPLAICYEVDDKAPGYAHIRALVDGQAVEPWPRQRRKVSACTLILEAPGISFAFRVRARRNTAFHRLEWVLASS